MSHTIIITKRANNDINKIITYYNERSPKTTSSFINQLNIEFDIISEKPTAFPIHFSKVRKKVMSKLPFNIYYNVKPRKKEIIVARIWHQKRNPRALILK